MTKTVLITGTSSGIGRDTALYFQKKGWNVVATMRHPETRKTELHDKGLDLYHLDVTDPESVRKALEYTTQKYGRLDVLVNNAGYAVHGVFEASTDDEIRKQFDTNVIGLMNACKAVLPIFRKQKEGLIINVASVVGHISFPYYTLYNSSKWAVEGFSESLQYEIAQHNIRVKVIEPGIINTDFYDRSMVITKGDAVVPYQADFEKSTEKMHSTDSMGSKPIVIAKVIYKAALDKSKRLRYSGGGGAKFMLTMRKILPDWLFFALIRMATH